MSFREDFISGWGRRNFVRSKLLTLKNDNETCKFIKQIKSSCIPRGFGRAYGDAAQKEDDFVLNLFYSNQISVYENKVTVGAGVSIRKLLETIIPLGYTLPVSPGSTNITIGGAIAADVHGKNHHKVGSLGNHISRLLIIDGNGDIKELKPETKNKINNPFFWATIGGMGLTGIIIEATISLIKIETSLMKVNTYICKDLDEIMSLMKNKDKDYSYSVAWIDSFHKKYRGVLTCAEHALKNDLDRTSKNHLTYASPDLSIPKKFTPQFLLNKYSVKAFNEFWFKKSTISKKSISTITNFFYPLDKINNWNLIYGTQGFFQYQYFIPEDKSYFIEESLALLNNYSIYSYLVVLKKFGVKKNGYLSFPEPGWTLALDFPGSNKKVLNVLEELDSKLLALGGKIYLAKDSRQSPEMFKASYPEYSEWRKIKSQMDPKNIFESDLSRRLEI